MPPSPRGVRRGSGEAISHHGEDCCDDLLLAECRREWQPAPRVIGAAMWECDEYLGDVFFAWRLRCLVAAGRLEWRGPARPDGQAQVRLPPAAVGRS